MLLARARGVVPVADGIRARPLVLDEGIAAGEGLTVGEAAAPDRRGQRAQVDHAREQRTRRQIDPILGAIRGPRHQR